MDRDDLAVSDDLLEPQASEERADVGAGPHGDADPIDRVQDGRIDDAGEGSDGTAGAPDGEHGLALPGEGETSVAPAGVTTSPRPSPPTDEVTVLRCRPGKRATKRWRRDKEGSLVCDQYDAGMYFDARANRVAGIRDIHRLLLCLAPNPQAFVIRGALSEPMRESAKAKREYDRLRRAAGPGKPIDPAVRDDLRHRFKLYCRLLHPQPGSPDTFMAVPRRWLCTDIDGLPLPDGLDIVTDPELDFGHSGQAWQRRSARRGRGGGAGERRLARPRRETPPCTCPPASPPSS